MESPAAPTFWRFSFLQGRGLAVPYAGTIRPRVEELSPGLARVRLEDQRAVRNHLCSVHACALANLGETTAGMAMMSLQPPGERWIVTRMDVEFLKKARGTLTCECRLDPWPTEPGEFLGLAQIRNRDQEVVCAVTVHYKIGSR